MSTAKIAIILEKEMLVHLDRLVRELVFPNRSKAIQQALREKLARLEGTRLGRECRKLDPADE